VTDQRYPELTDDAIERASNKLLHEFFATCGGEITLPVPVERIAEKFLGYRIELTDQGLFADPAFLGGVDFQTETIFVNASVENHDGRYAFTIAHELGHHVLHRMQFLSYQPEGEEGIMCRSSTKRPMIEYQADRFAAALLMPSEALNTSARKLSRKFRAKHGTNALAARLITEGGFSNVSREAMRYRLRELKLNANPLMQPRVLLIPSLLIYRLFRYLGRR